MSERYDRLQDGLTFGSGDYLGLLLNRGYEEFQRLSEREQALLVGYADGCPVALALTDPAYPDENRGPEAMLDRYGEVNFWFRQIVHAAEEHNPALAHDLTVPVVRQEPFGEQYEQETVPDTFYDEMSPLGTLWGYAASRLLVKQLGGEGLTLEESQERLDAALTILESSVTEAQSREELLALIAEAIAAGGDVDSTEVLHDALSLGWYGEHHASGMVDDVKTALRAKAPRLWEHYEDLSEAKQAKAGIIGEASQLATAAGPISIEGLRAYHDENFGYTLWEDVVDPANPDGPRGIVMHVPSRMISKVWELLEDDYEERVELLRGSGSFIYQPAGSEDWVTAPLDTEHPTADELHFGKGDKFGVVADEGGIVIFSRPSKPFHISFERGLTVSARDTLSTHLLAMVSLSQDHRI